MNQAATVFPASNIARAHLACSWHRYNVFPRSECSKSSWLVCYCISDPDFQSISCFDVLAFSAFLAVGASSSPGLFDLIQGLTMPISRGHQRTEMVSEDSKEMDLPVLGVNVERDSQTRSVVDDVIVMRCASLSSPQCTNLAEARSQLVHCWHQIIREKNRGLVRVGEQRVGYCLRQGDMTVGMCCPSLVTGPNST